MITQGARLRRLGSARLCSVRLRSTRLGSAMLGHARLGLGSVALGASRLGSAELPIGSLTARSLSDWWEDRPAGARALGLPWQCGTLRGRARRDPDLPPPHLSAGPDQDCRNVVPTGFCVPVPTGSQIPVPTGGISSSREAVCDG